MPNERKKYLKQMTLSLLIFLMGEGLTLTAILLTPVLWLGIILAVIGHILFISSIVGGYFSIDAYVSYKPLLDNELTVLPAAPAPTQSMQHDYGLIILYKNNGLLIDNQETVLDVFLF